MPGVELTTGWRMQTVKFRAVAFTGGHKLQHHVKMLKEGVDVAVCTPGRLIQLVNSDSLCFDHCKVLLFATHWFKSTCSLIPPKYQHSPLAQPKTSLSFCCF
jgi:hypothetical protein